LAAIAWGRPLWVSPGGPSPVGGGPALAVIAWGRPLGVSPRRGEYPVGGGPALAAIAWGRPLGVSPRRGEYPVGGGGRSGPGVPWSLGRSDGAGWCHAPRAASDLSAPSGPPGHLPLRGRTRVGCDRVGAADGGLPPERGVPGGPSPVGGGPVLAVIAWGRPLGVSPRRGEYGNPSGSLGRGALRSWCPLEPGPLRWCRVVPRSTSRVWSERPLRPSGPPPPSGEDPQRPLWSQPPGRGVGLSPNRCRSRTRHDAAKRGETSPRRNGDRQREARYHRPGVRKEA